MKIIDAHLHLFNPDERSETMARQVGHENSLPYLENLYKSQGVVAGVVMGNQKLSPDAYRFPPFFRYCIAVGSKYQGPKEEAQTIELAEEHLLHNRPHDPEHDDDDDRREHPRGFANAGVILQGCSGQAGEVE